VDLPGAGGLGVDTAYTFDKNVSFLELVSEVEVANSAVLREIGLQINSLSVVLDDDGPDGLGVRSVGVGEREGSA
jgi:hypothetical protein